MDKVCVRHFVHVIDQISTLTQENRKSTTNPQHVEMLLNKSTSPQQIHNKSNKWNLTYIRHTSMGMTQQFFVFCACWPWPLTLTFERGRDFCTMYLTPKFDRPTFSRSEFIVRTNIQTNWQTHWQTNRCRWKHPLCFATLRRWLITHNIYAPEVSPNLKCYPT